MIHLSLDTRQREKLLSEMGVYCLSTVGMVLLRLTLLLLSASPVDGKNYGVYSHVLLLPSANF
jgi:hypothetical protein